MIYEEPIPHYIIKGDPLMYARGLKTFTKNKRNLNYKKNIRQNSPINDEKLKKYLEGVLSNAYISFKPYLQKAYPKWVLGEPNFKTYYSINPASDKPFNPRMWHLDTGEKVLIGLWYAKHPDDDAGGDLYISDRKKYKKIPYDTNNLVIIPNLPNAWHSVSKRQPSKYDRLFFNFMMTHNGDHLHDYRRNADGSDEFKPITNNYK